MPLLDDIRSQAPALRRWLFKLALFLVLFLALDRLLGLVLRGGLDRYYGLNTPCAVLCVGHSHTVLGIDKVQLERELGVPVAKFAVEGANTADRQVMIRYFFSRQPNSVRAVVYDVDAHTFTSAGLSSASYQLLFPFIDDPGVRGYIRRNCKSQTEYLLRRWLCTPRYNELMLSLVARGYLKKWSNFKFGQVDVGKLEQQIKEGRYRRIAFDEDNLRVFGDTARFVGSHNAQFLMTYIPTIDVMNYAEPEKFRQSIAHFEALAATNPAARFLDYNAELQSRHELFFDPIHMNPAGQKELTDRLARDLARILATNAIPASSNPPPR